MTGRETIVITQLKADGLYPDTDAPDFNQHGGVIPVGFQLRAAERNKPPYLLDLLSINCVDFPLEYPDIRRRKSPC